MNSGVSRAKTILIQPHYPTSPFKDLYFPVGLGYIAEILELNGIEYEVCDLNLEDTDVLFGKIKQFNPEYIGLSLMSLDIIHHYGLIEKIKNTFPGVKIITGGPHISFVKERALRECTAIDYGIVHEGEDTLIELLNGFNKKTIKGLIYRDESGNVIYTGDRGFFDDLNSLPFPKYEKFDSLKYGAYISIASSRGCPFSCTFCGAHISMGKKWRARNALALMDEILYWYNIGYRFFNFVDSNFFLSKERIFELLNLLEKHKVKITMNSDGFRASDANYEMLSRMKKFGFTSVALGIESANDDILKNIKKGVSLYQIENCLKILEDIDISVVGFFIIGLPGETRKHVLNSFKFALKYPNFNSVNFHNLNPIPETELYKWADKNEFLRLKDSKQIYYNIGGMGKDILIETPELSLKERKVLYILSKIISLLVKVKYNIFKEMRKIHSFTVTSDKIDIEN